MSSPLPKITSRTIINQPIPRPVPRDWKSGIGDIKRPPPAEFVHSSEFGWPEAKDLVEMPELREAFVQILPKTDHARVTAADQYSQDLEIHIDGMLQDRIYFMRALRAFVHWVYDTYVPGPNLNVAEMGCGPALLLHGLAPGRLRKNWQAFDIEKNFVEIAQAKARRQKLPARVSQRSAYEPMHASPLNPYPHIWTGLSSFDALDVTLALQAMEAPAGTKFIHVQDLYPAVDNILHFERKFPDQRVDWLVTSSAIEEYGLDRLKELLEQNRMQEAFSIIINFGMNREGKLFFRRGGEILSPPDEFHGRLLFCLQDAGFKIIDQGTAMTTYVGEMTPEQEALAASDLFKDGARPGGYINSQGDYFPLMTQPADPTHPLPEREFCELLIANFVVAEKI